jgi:hypothetical protein
MIHMKGFLRLSVVLFVIVWLGLSIFLLLRNSHNVWLVWKHYSPYLSYPAHPSDEDWTVYTASQDFLSRSNADRTVIAEGFFQQHKELARELNFDVEELRAWFLKTAIMSTSEAPIRTYESFGSGRDPISYRDFPSKTPSVRISKIFFSPSLLGYSFLITLAILAIILLIFLPLRWVIKGFRNSRE